MLCGYGTIRSSIAYVRSQVAGLVEIALLMSFGEVEEVRMSQLELAAPLGIG